MNKEFIMARYGKPEFDVEKVDYAEVLNKVFAQKAYKLDSLESVLELVNDLAKEKVFRINETSLALVKYDEATKEMITLVKNKDLLQSLLMAKTHVLSWMKSSTMDLKSKSKLIYFFRFSFKEELDEKEYEQVLNSRKTMEFIKTDELVKETRIAFDFPHHNEAHLKTKTLADYFTFSREENVYLNRYRERFVMFKFMNKKNQENSDRIYPIYVPLLTNSVYTLNQREFVQANEYYSFINKRGLAIGQSIKNIIQYYQSLLAYNFDDYSVITENVQNKLFTIFFEKQTFTPSKMEWNSLNVPTPWKEFKKAETYEFQPFIDVTELTRNEKISEFFKVRFKEFINSTIDNSKIKERWGKEGFGTLNHFPLKKIDSRIFDSSFVSATSKFLYTYRDEQRTPMALELNPFAIYNKISIRNSMGAYTALKALFLKKNDTPLTMGVKSRFFSKIPKVTLWFLNDDIRTTDGYTQKEGQRTIDPEVAKEYGLFMGMKLATHDLNKGVVNISNTDRFYFVHNGEKIYLNIMSSQDMMKRMNFGSFLESSYNGKKFLDGKREVESRNFTEKPLKENELMELKEVFRETKESTTSLGMKSVTLWTMMYVHETDTTFDEDEEVEDNTRFTLGVEAIQRMLLECGPALVQQFIKTDEERREISKKIREKTLDERLLYGKYGRITELYKYKGLGFNSTVVGNDNLAFNHRNIWLIKEDVQKMLILLKKFYRDDKLAYEIAEKSLLNGETVNIDGLLVRNPSIDAGNFIPGSTTIRIADDRFNKSIIEVNPSAWKRQGGDFDGDQGYILFIRKIQLVRRVYSLDYIGIKEIKDVPNTSLKDLEHFLDHNAALKRTSNLTVEDILTPLSIEELRESTGLDPVVVHIGKSVVGVAKTVTMKPLAYLTAYDLSDSLKKYIIKVVNSTNEFLVQKAIDIAKWANNIDEVLSTVELSYALSKAIDKKLAELVFDVKKDLVLKPLSPSQVREIMDVIKF